jgi:hypothetical protein
VVEVQVGGFFRFGLASSAAAGEEQNADDFASLNPGIYF